MSRPRTHEIDVIRLFALLGICIVNIYMMGTIHGLDAIYTFSEKADELADVLSTLFVEGKFVVMFSFVLGWSIAAQEKRFSNEMNNFKAYYFRRAFGFILLGCLHVALVYDGDVLLSYGLISLCFWYMRSYVLSVPFKALVKQFVVLNYVYIAVLVALGIVFSSITDFDDPLPYTGNEELTGAFYDTLKYRLSDGLFTSLQGYFIFVFQILACFSFGYLANYSGFFCIGSESFEKLKKYSMRLLVGGLVLTLPYAIYINTDTDSALLQVTGLLFSFFADLMISAAYLYFIVTFARRINLPELFILAGRNSLSVYILQGLMASLLFNGYGFGLIGQLGTIPLLLIGIFIYLSAVLIIGCYVKAFGHGVLEPVLRRINGSQLPKRYTL